MEKLETKLYQQMTTKEQLVYITNLSDFAKDKFPRLEKLGDAWEQSDRKDFETGLRLLTAFGFARDYCHQSLFYGDYNRRVSRINYYLERIKKEIAKGNTLKGADGETLAFVPALKQSRRRGRPTKEEKAQMEAEKANESEMSLQNQKAYAIANLLGLSDNIATEIPQREKTDAEKVAEVKAKENAEATPATTTPSPQLDLFAQIGNTIESEKAATVDKADTAASNTTELLSSSSLEDEKEIKYRLPLQQIKCYLSADLAANVDQVRELRATFASKAEKAKLLAEQGAKPEDVAPYAQEAHDLNDKIENIYAAVDKELAMVYGRLRDDDAYAADFKKKYQVSDIEPIKKELKVYYDKMPETFASEVESVIRENNPDVIAEKEKAAATKAAADKIIKYLTRKDKPSTAKRLETMQKRIAELKTLIGEDAAAVYQPYVDKCEEEVKGYGKVAK